MHKRSPNRSQTTIPVERTFYTVSEFVERTRLGRTSIYGMIVRGELAAAKISGRTLIPASEMDRLLATATRSESA